MFSICREFGVERPLTNHRIDVGDRTFYADFCWPELGLIVEADSWRWHGGRLARRLGRRPRSAPLDRGLEGGPLHP